MWLYDVLMFSVTIFEFLAQKSLLLQLLTVTTFAAVKIWLFSQIKAQDSMEMLADYIMIHSYANLQQLNNAALIGHSNRNIN